VKGMFINGLPGALGHTSQRPEDVGPAKAGASANATGKAADEGR
jgi:hypothetical protein